jgi:hypothetical protein
MVRYRIVFKTLEIVVSTAFLILCAKARGGPALLDRWRFS